jgi:hypothetical protein
MQSNTHTRREYKGIIYAKILTTIHVGLEYRTKPTEKVRSGSEKTIPEPKSCLSERITGTVNLYLTSQYNTVHASIKNMLLHIVRYLRMFKNLLQTCTKCSQFIPYHILCQ